MGGKLYEVHPRNNRRSKNFVDIVVNSVILRKEKIKKNPIASSRAKLADNEEIASNLMEANHRLSEEEREHTIDSYKDIKRYVGYPIEVILMDSLQEEVRHHRKIIERFIRTN